MANRNGSGASALRRTIFSELRLAFEGPSPMSQVRRICKAEQIMATAVADRTDERPSPLSDTVVVRFAGDSGDGRSEEHTYEIQSLMRISYAVFCLKKKKR